MKYIFLLFGVISVLGCEKDSDDQDSDKVQLLTAAEWKYDSGGIGDANGNIILNFSSTSFIPACTFDNSVRFMANGDGTALENANVCPGVPASSIFRWSLTSNETVLAITGGAVAGLGGNFRIGTLSTTALQLLKDTTVSGFGAVTAVFNLRH